LIVGYIFRLNIIKLNIFLQWSIMKKIAIAFTGPSNSGKTTLIEKISYKLQGELKVAIIKHDPKDKAIFDREGKDSDKFFKSGADVAVVSPNRTTIFKHSTSSIKEIAESFKDYDLLMVEGLKHLPLPRVAVFRGEVNRDYLPYIKAAAVDDTVDKSILKEANIDILDLNNTQEIIDYILKNGEDIDAKDI
jgi:molybdopterin-guanine dinucleotide biosynthesis protein B